MGCRIGSWSVPSRALVALACGALASGCADDEKRKEPPPPTSPTGAHLTTAPGAPIGEPASATLGAGGGTLSSSDGGLRLTVPPGALAADTTLSITPVSAPASNAVSTYLLEPAGTVFAEPVSLTFGAADAGAGLSFLAVALHEESGTWRLEPELARDPAEQTLTVDVDHFSEYSMLRGYQLVPLGATVEVGEPARFEIVACAEPSALAQIAGESLDGVEDVPDLLVYECRPVYFGNSSSDRWSVDGVPGGDGTHGTIEPEGPFDAWYYVPGEKPDPDVVAVSAWFQYGETVRGTVLEDLLVARAAITDDEVYTGTFTVDAKGTPVRWKGTGTATWSKNPDSPLEFVVDGRVTPDETVFRLGSTTCTLDEPEQAFTFDAGNIKELRDEATVYWGIPPTTWRATCCDDGGGCGPVRQFLSLTWASGCGREWAALDPDEWEDGNLKGSYTWPSRPCSPVFPGMPTAEVAWYFTSSPF